MGGHGGGGGVVLGVAERRRRGIGTGVLGGCNGGRRGWAFLFFRKRGGVVVEGGGLMVW